MFCPNCDYIFRDKFKSDHVGVTLDCPNCGELLIVGMVLNDFHKYIHSINEEWPEDGKNTSYAEVNS